jgi:3-hydroxymyristoyl/3-hydroxydecanoyl-(acyl carrier protein) dehydratase
MIMEYITTKSKLRFNLFTSLESKKTRDFVYNIYGTLSGGFLVDVMDRVAQNRVIRKYPEYKYWFTSHIENVKYNRKVCNVNTDVIIECFFEKIDKNKIKVSTIMTDNNCRIICEGDFYFVGKDKNECEVA